MTEEWAQIKKANFTADTGVDMETLLKVGFEITKLPENSNFHPQIAKIFKAREQSIIDK